MGDRVYNHLSDVSKLQLGAMNNNKRRRQFSLARYLLSQCLNLRTQKNYVVDSLSTGQPYIFNSSFYCSISHSDELIAIAISNQGPIGVDIEQNCQRNFSSIVANYFHTDEIERFNRLPHQQQMKWFYQAWTHKEASAKATGEGLSNINLRKMPSADANLSEHQTKDYTMSCIHHGSKQIQLVEAQLLNNSPWLQTQPLL